MNELWRHRNTNTSNFNVSMLLTIDCTNTRMHSTNNYTILYHMNTLYNIMTSFSKQMFVSIWGNPSMDLKILRFCRAVRPSSSRVSSLLFFPSVIVWFHVLTDALSAYLSEKKLFFHFNISWSWISSEQYNITRYSICLFCEWKKSRSS